ncbi:MAG TPA: NAD(P)/FAD-dependent oxidoreductase [Pedomonas sp.]|uniref:NAD(P)/FAD-dependent oxidoreductase n=1 Tax=Pedomonas sp. TaxID=2976421 RepID=UPI002F3E28F0
MEAFDVIILGAGAAGLMCAAIAGQRGRRVLLLDHADKVGSKILISGGGRCNFTNVDAKPDRYLSQNPHFAKSALSRYTPRDFIDLVEKHGIKYHEKTLGQLFCDGSAREIVAMLMDECAIGGVDVQAGCRITNVSGGEGFRVETDRGSFHAPNLVLATGGPSIPKMGATSFAWQVAKRFGLAITETRPALVPLTVDGELLRFCQQMAGVAVDSVARCGKQSFREASLFTHRGLSGPAILQISSYWREGQAITLDLLPGLDALEFLKDRKRERPKAEAKSVLAEILPARLASALSDRLPLGPMANVQDKLLARMAAQLKSWEIHPSGSEGYAKAEVTLGGIDTNGLSSKTMEAKAVPGLYAIGEAVDVTGWLGGYNFQWAWASGWVAGQSI